STCSIAVPSQPSPSRRRSVNPERSLKGSPFSSQARLSALRGTAPGAGTPRHLTTWGWASSQPRNAKSEIPKEAGWGLSSDLGHFFARPPLHPPVRADTVGRFVFVPDSLVDEHDGSYGVEAAGPPGVSRCVQFARGESDEASTSCSRSSSKAGRE